jgi:hypothetical protein
MKNSDNVGDGVGGDRVVCCAHSPTTFIANSTDAIEIIIDIN